MSYLLSMTERSKAIAKEVKSLPELVSDVCLMAKYQTCGISGLRHEDIDWVQCSDCCGWYHCICVGIGLQGVQGLDFLCCKDSTTANNSMYVTI